MERAGNPFGMPVDERVAWTKGLPFPVPTLTEKPDPEVLYWVGCAVAFDPRAQKSLGAWRIFNTAGLDWAVLGKNEKCTGDTAGAPATNLLRPNGRGECGVLNDIKAKTIVTTCPHCFHTSLMSTRNLAEIMW